MKSYIRYIGIIDKNDKSHYVAFKEGVNIITGKSSTGKSAIIEIFDYCFGSDDKTIPTGIITANAKYYFTVLTINSLNLLLVRTQYDQKGVIKELETVDVNSFNDEFFSSFDFITIPQFRLILGRYLGINIDDTDLNTEDIAYKGKKAGRPSPRHITSYILQHQNLIANKHALFYRFEEKEKREQTIDQFKIFNGFVDQEYFILNQMLAEAEALHRRLVTEKKNSDDYLNNIGKRIDALLFEYKSIAGKDLFDIHILGESLVKQPKKYLDTIQNTQVTIEYASNENQQVRFDLVKEKNALLSSLRKKENELSNVKHSIKYAEEYIGVTENISTLDEAELHASQCPFCKSAYQTLSDEANQLEKAIDWLNGELSKSKPLLDSFKGDEKKIIDQIAEIRNKITEKDKSINLIDESIQKLDRNKSLEEQSLKVKLKVENLLEEVIQLFDKSIDAQLEKAKLAIESVKDTLKQKYNVEKQLKDAEDYINKRMNAIGQSLDFEESYQPINLRFSLETFELYHLSNQDKVYLRSMGSGANWLYCHLSLFLALQSYFCYLGDKCMIPTVLFIDQPSQVYFPSQVDTADEFDAKELKKKENKADETDEDIKAVTNMYNQLVKHCFIIAKETGIMPQIIVTDHADNLNLEEGITFNDLVQDRRWRKRGFIEPVPSI